MHRSVRASRGLRTPPTWPVSGSAAGQPVAAAVFAALLMLVQGCAPTGDAEGTGGAGGEVSADGGGPPGRLDAAVTQSSCFSLDLAAQCPVGSNPRIVTAGCVEGATVTDAEGNTAGLCTREGECLFVCDFQNPCRCGIDRITRDGITCTDCALTAACGDAVCDRGENPDTCPEDCGAVCTADAERCAGNDRQVCDENTRWSTLACRVDQQCDFGQLGAGVVTVCQTRISRDGGLFPGFGAQTEPVVGDSTAIRFRERALPDNLRALRFVAGGARVLAVEIGSNRVVVVDPLGEAPEQPTHITQTNGELVTSETHVARPGRWPQVSDFFEDVSQNVEPMVHDGALAQGRGAGLSSDGSLLAAAFAVGLAGGEAEPVLGLWRTADGRIERLLRFVDRDLVASTGPATAAAVSINNQVALEARPGDANRGSTGRVIIVWEVATGRYAHLIQADVGDVRALVPSVDGHDLLAIGGSEGVELWSLTPEVRRRWRKTGIGVTGLALSPDATTLAAGLPPANANASPTTLLLHADDGRTLQTLGTGGALDFHPAGGRLLVGNVIYGADL